MAYSDTNISIVPVNSGLEKIIGNSAEPICYEVYSPRVRDPKNPFKTQKDINPKQQILIPKTYKQNALLNANGELILFTTDISLFKTYLETLSHGILQEEIRIQLNSYLEHDRYRNALKSIGIPDETIDFFMKCNYFSCENRKECIKNKYKILDGASKELQEQITANEFLTKLERDTLKRTYNLFKTLDNGKDMFKVIYDSQNSQNKNSLNEIRTYLDYLVKLCKENGNKKAREANVLERIVGNLDILSDIREKEYSDAEFARNFIELQPIVDVDKNDAKKLLNVYNHALHLLKEDGDTPDFILFSGKGLYLGGKEVLVLAKHEPAKYTSEAIFSLYFNRKS